jgi:hypothetical protein
VEKIFISYKHASPWAGMAETFRTKFSNYGIPHFIDTHIDPGVPWRSSVDAALAGCTRFLCLLCDAYWGSEECRRELDAVLARRKAGGKKVRLLFVLAERMRIGSLRFDPRGKPVGDVAKVGDFNLLGPRNLDGQLVPLVDYADDWGADQLWKAGEAIEKMIDRMEGCLAR